MEEFDYSVIVTNNQQIPVKATPGTTVTFQMDGETVKDQVKLDVTEAEFIEIQDQAVTNDIPADILTNRKAAES